MLLLPPRPTLTATLFPYPTLVRSHPDRAFPPHGSPAAAPFPPLPSEWGRTALPPALSAAAARAGGAPESRGRPPIRPAFPAPPRLRRKVPRRSPWSG